MDENIPPPPPVPKKVKSTMSRYFIKSFMQHGRRLLEDAGLGLFVPRVQKGPTLGCPAHCTAVYHYYIKQLS